MSTQQINRALATVRALKAAADSDREGITVDQLIAVYNAQQVADAVGSLGSDINALESTLSSSLA